MICIVATLTTVEGKGPVLEEIMIDMAAKVKANEPGCFLYQLAKSRDEANVYKVLEVYAAQDAMEAHMASEHFKALGPKLAGLLTGRPKLEILDGVD
jgi:quinol monooxygenase YgiN